MLVFAVDTKAKLALTKSAQTVTRENIYTKTHTHTNVHTHARTHTHCTDQ